MAYHTIMYLCVFLPLVLLAYQLTPKKYRWVTLLMAGYAFFYLISKKLVIFLIGTSIFTHYIGIWLDQLKQTCKCQTMLAEKEEKSTIKKQYKKKEKQVLTVGILMLLSVLAYLKYYNFFAVNANGLLGTVGSGFAFKIQQILLPIGISFYTLQAIGYMVDVYWDKISGQQPLGKVALFLGFFPQIMEGPIAMYSQTADALWEGKSLEIDNLTQGAVRIFWGLFKKMIIADRLFILVNAVFQDYAKYNGIIIAVGAVAYTVQLYMEFSGSMDMILGSGQMLGITLPENFRQPFISRNAAEFWRRWHITLGVWLKTYVFYPVSMSKPVKKWNQFGRKHCGKYITKLGVSAIALFPVWLCNGLWHGPRWSYIFYGMYYFTVLMGGLAIEPVRNKVIEAFHINENALYYRIPQILKTWVIIFTGELFFRANGLKAGWSMFRSMFSDFGLHRLWDGTLLTFGLDQADYLIIGLGCVAVAIVGSIKERGLLKDVGIQGLKLPVRWALYYGLIFAVIIFGAYGIGYQQVDLIYAGF